jgi:hypothetical protein
MATKNNPILGTKSLDQILWNRIKPSPKLTSTSMMRTSRNKQHLLPTRQARRTGLSQVVVARTRNMITRRNIKMRKRGKKRMGSERSQRNRRIHRMTTTLSFPDDYIIFATID